MSRLSYKNNFKSDIFNQNNAITKREKLQKKYHNLSQSDVFNEKATDQPQPTGVIRNHSQSNIFFILKQGNHLKTPLTSKANAFVSNYNPSNYLKCESAFKHKMKDIYSVNEEALKDLPTTKGYLAKDEYLRNCPIRKKNEYKEGCNRLNKKGNAQLSNSAYLEHEAGNGKHKGSRLEFLKSNIFFDKAKDEANHQEMGIKRSDKDEERSFQYTQPKLTLREQWHSKLDWRKGQTELVLSRYYKTSTYRRAKSAFDRKMNDMRGNDVFNTQVKDEEVKCSKIPKESIVNPLKEFRSRPIPSAMQQRGMKVLENSSSQFDDHFYEEAYKLKTVKEEAKPDHRYTIQHKGNLLLSELKQTFQDKGLLVYDISASESSIIRDDSNKAFTFKVKGNNRETFNAKMKEIESKLSHEKGVKVEPFKYISVNRIDISKAMAKESQRTKKTNNDKNSQFSKKFDWVNHQYKKR